MRMFPPKLLAHMALAAALATAGACVGPSRNDTATPPDAQAPNDTATEPSTQPNVNLPGNGNTSPAAPASNGNGKNPNVVGPVISPNVVAAIGTLGGPNNAYVLVGRFDNTNPQAIRFSLPNSRLGATFTGSSLSVSLAGTGSDVFSVQVDNNPEVVVTTAPSAVQQVYPVAANLPPGNHVAWLTKRTEASEQDQTNPNFRTGTAIFGGFVLAADGALGAPPAPRPHLIVALGDSSFTGYGVGALQANGNTCVYSPATQNAQLSVPGQLAELLNAEITNVSASGKGLVQSAYDLNNTDQLVALWGKTVPPNAAPAYNFPALDVDAVVICAGSDDLVGAYGSGVITNPTLFVSQYTALLANMRLRYPKAVLVGIVNPNAIQTDKSQLTALIGQAVANRTAAADANVFLFDYFAGDPQGWISYNDADRGLNLGHGCQGHASAAGSLFMADRLAKFLRLHATF